MEFNATTTVHADRAAVFAAATDLATYPAWFAIVGEATPTSADPGDPGPAWTVTLQARLGPLVRRKRLRMVRADLTAPATPPATPPDETGGAGVRFERRELDGRSHGIWVLTVSAAPVAGADSPSGSTTLASTSLTVGLRYDGVGWVPGVDLLLREEARRAGRRLEVFLASG